MPPTWSAVPVLVTLTDRIDAKRVYLFGVGCTTIAHLPSACWPTASGRRWRCAGWPGVGWAGTYMTGLKLLADQVDAKMMSRAVTGHAASIGISGAASYIAGRASGRRLRLAAGVRERRPHRRRSPGSPWRSPCPARPPPPGQPQRPAALFDFRPVLRNRSAFAYSLAYCVHTLEMNALRGWGVAFLAWVAAPPA